MKLDDDFFSTFKQDLQQPSLWKQFHERRGAEGRSTDTADLPPLPNVDAEGLFWEMMRVSRSPDPYMFPALKKLKAAGQFLMGALSNTVIFPPGHPYNDDQIGLRDQFDFFVSSAHSGLRKPDSRIYEYALQNMNDISRGRGGEAIQPSDVLFLDDIGENLKAAKQAGFRTLKVILGKSQYAVKELETITGFPLFDTEERPKL
jgi:microsomal epoxide hydrolase